ncbi:MAG: outer membrane beta-barrel protein [Bacteroidales bacterium]
MQLLTKLRNFVSSIIRKSARILLLLIISSLTLNANAQNYKVEGTIIDKTDNQPVIGAFVFMTDLKDTTERVATTTDLNGRFTLAGLKKKSYNLTIQSINYKLVKQVIALSKPVTNLGTLILEMDSKVLSEVVIVGQGTAVQKGDTTIMTADAFKVNVDASAEDLVKKMPGITVENGTIKARGEDVKKVLVDGKPFFGDDPSVALRNLPADVIDRVQVYNKLSDQAELTGFDDGESERTINIITRRSNVYSKFGKITGGTNFDDKYLVAGNLNIFSGPRRFTFSGMTNNVNQQNFAMQDLIGTSGGGGYGGGWGGRQFGGSSGISKNSSFGFNYQDNWGKKASVSGSYFFNSSSNTNITNSLTKYVSDTENGNSAVDSSETLSENYNHRFNMRIEYKIDSLNSLIIVPRFSLQENNSDRISSGLIYGGSEFSESLNNSISDATGYNLGNNLIWRHKFLRPGRTLSVRSSISYDKRNSSNTQIASVNSIPDNQLSDAATDNLTLNTNFNYTEPIGKYSQLQLNFDNRFRNGSNNNEIYKLGITSENLGRLDSLSNVYESNYMTNRGGISYLFKKDKLNLSAGINYERADLNGTQTYPLEARVDKTFQKLLPSAMINYKFSDLTNLRLFYRTSTNAPSITQLQTAIDNSDRMRIRTGNPHLKQSYSHNLYTNFSYANPTTGFNTFVYLSGNYSSDIIANRTLLAGGDTLIQPEGINVVLLPRSQLSFPVNLDNSWRLNTMVNLSYFVKPIKSNVSLVIGGGYSESPEYIQTSINTQNTYNITNSLIVTSNISEKVDFTLSYTSNYTKAQNSITTLSDEEYWYQSASAKVNLVLFKGITFNTDVVGQYNKGGSNSSFNEKYMVWNASMGKKFLKNKAAELKVGLYDILDQNKSFYHTVTASNTTDTWTNAYKRYFLVLFTYNLRARRSEGPQPQQQEGRPWEGRPGMPGGMPSGGMPRQYYHNQ